MTDFGPVNFRGPHLTFRWPNRFATSSIATGNSTLLQGPPNMAIAILAWLIAIPILGFMTGLRSMTPMAVLSWFAWRHHMPLRHTWAFWVENAITVGVFTVLALGEYVGDTLPNTPNRTAPFPLVGRLCFGGLVGAIAATALHGSAIEGILLGAISALAGTFIGFHLRAYLPGRLGVPDLAIAVFGDLLALGGSVLAMGIVTG